MVHQAPRPRPAVGLVQPVEDLLAGGARRRGQHQRGRKGAAGNTCGLSVGQLGRSERPHTLGRKSASGIVFQAEQKAEAARGPNYGVVSGLAKTRSELTEKNSGEAWVGLRGIDADRLLLKHLAKVP